MNYYEKHVGDYLRDTAHLSLLEHGIYSRLLDVYYTREGALPQDVARLIGARSKDEKTALESVLAEFFESTADGWTHKRCEAEIARFKDKQSKAKRSAEARWNAHRSHSDGNANGSPNAMRTHTEGNALQSPDTSINTPIPPSGVVRGRRSKTDPQAIGFAEFYAGYPRKVARAAAERAWSKLHPDEPLREKIMTALAVNGFDYRDGGRFIPHPASWLNAHRWDDEPAHAEAHGDEEWLRGAR